MKLVTTHLEAADTYNSIAEDKTMNMKTTMGVHEGINVTVMKCHAKGLTVEDFKEFYAPGAMFANVTKVDKIITGRQLEDFEGFPMLYQHVKTPMMVSNRCTIFSQYDWADGDSWISLGSSAGNQQYAKDHPELIGKDVLCTLYFGYNKFTPSADGSGVDIEEAICVDTAGTLPDFVKTMIAKSNSEITIKSIKHMQKAKGIATK